MIPSGEEGGTTGIQRRAKTHRNGRLRRLISRRSPQALLVWGFAGLIIVGAILLMLPISRVAGRVDPLAALFTSTSAVCVTGLIVVDTARDFTVFGQVVILVLIQLGGLGVMTFAALLFRVLGRRMSLSTQAALHDSFSQKDMAVEFRSLFGGILRTVSVIEFTGFVLLFLSLQGTHSVGRALYSALFHSVSSFCNAGFSIYSSNLLEIENNAPALCVIMVLIVLGGLGHVVLRELWEVVVSTAHGQRHRPGGRVTALTLHARVVLITSGILIVTGAGLLVLTGLGPDHADVGSRIWAGLFQSVTARTAGFNTVPIGALPVASLTLLSGLMFIGGSPGSCAGGVKTTSAAIYFAQVRALLGRHSEARLLGRALTGDVVQRAGQVFMLAAGWNLIGVLLLAAVEVPGSGFNLEQMVFEQLSAFGTVGLSADVTPTLSVVGRMWIIATMFVGRLGPLTLATWVTSGRGARVKHPEGRVMIG